MHRVGLLCLCLLSTSTQLCAQQYVGVGIRSGFANFFPAKYSSENLGYALPNPASLTIGKVYESSVLTTWLFGRSEIAVNRGMAIGVGARFYTPSNFGKSSYLKPFAECFIGVVGLPITSDVTNDREQQSVTFASIGISCFVSQLRSVDIFVGLLDTTYSLPNLRSNAYFGIGYNHFWTIEKKPKRIRPKKINDCPERYD
ncbi:hypothetical protein DYU11_07980 [Fibrisoma montanum]|uniref:Outer membrane protein beta-barrel domain-containing protein n=1 Tax=Fibrisoma montanum TaxID=2305895 RepID=A0A418MES2_9BACT|nr:hypothetical protein [Fibrisoma montanum]RIV25237.1 hypothetical protein DYU11_07980 [Fibrisoma montanum]